MTFPPIFSAVQKTPEMYLPAGTYEAAVSFVLGYDAAANGGVLFGFREWLITQLNTGNNLTWPALVLELINRPAHIAVSADGSRATKDQRAAVDALFSTIETFLRERSEPGGARRIFAAYERWLQGQEWYGPSSPDWILPSR